MENRATVFNKGWEIKLVRSEQNFPVDFFYFFGSDKCIRYEIDNLNSSCERQRFFPSRKSAFLISEITQYSENYRLNQKLQSTLSNRNGEKNHLYVLIRGPVPVPTPLGFLDKLLDFVFFAELRTFFLVLTFELSGCKNHFFTHFSEIPTHFRLGYVRTYETIPIAGKWTLLHNYSKNSKKNK